MARKNECGNSFEDLARSLTACQCEGSLGQNQLDFHVQLKFYLSITPPPPDSAFQHLGKCAMNSSEQLKDCLESLATTLENLAFCLKS